LSTISGDNVKLNSEIQKLFVSNASHHLRIINTISEYSTLQTQTQLIL